MNAENNPPKPPYVPRNKDVPGAPTRVPTLRHLLVLDTDLAKHRDAAYTDGLHCDVLEGHATIVLTWDPNTGRLVRTRYSDPELAEVAIDFERQADLPSSTVQLAMRKIVGELPFIGEGRKRNEGEAEKEARLAKRQTIMITTLKLMKQMYGTLPKATKAEASIERIEEELHRYHRRGNPLSIGVQRYLMSSDAESEDPLPEFGSEVPAAFKDILPLVFDPRKISSMSKLIYRLRQDKGGLAWKESSEETVNKKREVAAANLELANAKWLAADIGVPFADYIDGARGGEGV